MARLRSLSDSKIAALDPPKAPACAARAANCCSCISETLSASLFSMSVTFLRKGFIKAATSPGSVGAVVACLAKEVASSKSGLVAPGIFSIASNATV